MSAAGDAAGDAAALALPAAVARAPRRLPRVLRRHPGACLGGLLLLAMLGVAIAAPWLGTIDPATLLPRARLRDPSAQYWFGTDMMGRDLYSRVIYGARVSLLIGFTVAGLSCLLGMAIGLVSGFLRGVDGVLMRVMDGIMAIPSILLAIALMALLRGSVVTVIIALTVVDVPRVARLVRGVTLSLREEVFVQAAIAAGTRTPMIILRHILPNALPPIIVQATYLLGSAMLAEATLSFIGAGTPPTVPSWGNIVAEGRTLWQVKPHLIFFPAIFLSLAVLAVNLLGDGLRDALDPREAER
ncbi:ABC transporter permease [Roseomonas sp. 18066]|uniref:ABC transporter permease n=1 Tax=Roseomonas sp. 18066 TaxID=2681412 RepID=UPI001F41161F|nr:ABC transporter permease [Roseomonas sp. 18066]